MIKHYRHNSYCQKAHITHEVVPNGAQGPQGPPGECNCNCDFTLIMDELEIIENKLVPKVITKIEKVKEIQYKVIETTIYKETKDPKKIGTKKVREINYGTTIPNKGWEPGPRGWYIKHAKYGRTYYSPSPKGKPLYSEDEFNKMFSANYSPSYRHINFGKTQ